MKVKKKLKRYTIDNPDPIDDWPRTDTKKGFKRELKSWSNDDLFKHLITYENMTVKCIAEELESRIN